MGRHGFQRAVERRLAHLAFGSRRWLEHRITESVGDMPAGRVLEIGSGRQDDGAGAYSMRHLFGDGVEFIESDVNPDFGHLVVDLTTMAFDEEFDVILCVSVLEHVPEFWKAAPRIRQALRVGGKALISTPLLFPYHDEPHDYWRLTEHGMRQILEPFDQVLIRHRGPRLLPTTVLVIVHRLS